MTETNESEEKKSSDTVPVDEVVEHGLESRVEMTGERVDEILDRISEMELKLDYDPILKGPKFLTEQTAVLRNYMNEAQRYQEEVNRKKVKLRRRLRGLESEYDIRYDDLMVSDPEVQDFGNQSQRESMVRYKLREIREEIDSLKRQVSDLEAVEEAIDNKYSHLRETGWDLSRQQKLIRDELKAGGHWGDEREARPRDDVSESEVEIDPDEVERAGAVDDDFDVDDLLSGFSEPTESAPDDEGIDPDEVEREMEGVDTDVDVEEYMKSKERDDKREHDVDHDELSLDEFEFD